MLLSQLGALSRFVTEGVTICDGFSYLWRKLSQFVILVQFVISDMMW